MTYTQFLTFFPDHCIQLFDDQGIDRSKAETINGLTVDWDKIKTANEHGAGVFFSVNKFSKGIRKTSYCEGINAWFAECDTLSLEQQQTNLDKLLLQPSFTVQTKKSLHAYWLAENGTMDNFRVIQEWLAKRLHGDKSMKDFARVLRIPEFQHKKDPNNPVTVKIIQDNHHLVYTEQQMLDEFVDFKQIAEEQKRQIQKIKEIEAKYKISGSEDTYNAINQISIETIVANVMNWRWDERKHWYQQGSQAPSACFKAIDGNYLIHGGTHYFSDAQTGYTPFSFIKMIKNLDDKDTFLWFIDKYQNIADIDKQRQGEWINEQQTNEKKNTDSVKIFKISKSKNILKMETKAVKFIIDRMVAEKTITVISAKSGVGKSLLVLIMAKHIGDGTPLFDKYAVQQKNVLVIDQEMPDDILIDRYKAIVKTKNNVDFLWQQSWLITDEEHFNWLKQAIKNNNYQVIIFDMLDAIHEKNENDNSEMKIINRKLIRLINETGISIILLHQHRKEDSKTKSSQDSAQGAGEIIHKATSHLIIDRKDSKLAEEDNQQEITSYILKQHKSRRPEKLIPFQFEVSYHLENKITNWRFVRECDENLIKIEEVQSKIINLINNEQGEWTVENLLEKLKMGKSSIRQALKILEEKNILDSHKGINKNWNTNYYFKNNEI